jgi:hypothetical protein
MMVQLWRFSQSEIDGTADGFIDAVFTVTEVLTHQLTPMS